MFRSSGPVVSNSDGVASGNDKEGNGGVGVEVLVCEGVAYGNDGGDCAPVGEGCDDSVAIGLLVGPAHPELVTKATANPASSHRRILLPHDLCDGVLDDLPNGQRAGRVSAGPRRRC